MSEKEQTHFESLIQKLQKPPYSFIRKKYAYFDLWQKKKRKEDHLLYEEGMVLNMDLLHHIELKPDALVLMSSLKTMALIYDCPRQYPSDDDQPSSVNWQSRLKQTIDHATYLRITLATELADPWSVHLVLAFDENPRLETSPYQGVDDVLSDSGGTTYSSHNLALHLAFPGQDNEETEGLLRRALCWTLAHNRQRWQPSDPVDSKAELPKMSLRLEHFKLCKKRTIEFTSDKPMHLIHGNNGSGKTTVAEALQLALLKRLPNHDHDVDLVASIRCRDSKEGNVKAELTVDKVYEWPQGTDETSEVAACTIFLSQHLMSQLTFSSPRERYKALLDYFFPSADELVERHAELETKLSSYHLVAKSALNKPHADESIAQSRVREATSWRSICPEKGIGKEADILKLVAPFQLKDFDLFSVYIREWHKLSQDWHEVFKGKDETDKSLRDWFAQFDVGLGRFNDFPVKEFESALATLKSLCQRYHHLNSNHGQQSLPYAEVMGKWLRQYALVDLAERRYQMANFAHAFDKWQGVEASWFKVKAPDQDLKWRYGGEKYLDDQRMELGHLRSNLLTADETKSEAAELQRYDLNDDERHHLELLQNLFPGKQILKDRFESWFRQLSFKETDADLDASVAEIETRIEELEQHWPQAQAKFDAYKAKRVDPVVQLYQQGCQFLQTYRVWELVQKELEQVLLSELKEIEAPLDELMALMSPFSWAYRSLKIAQDSNQKTLNYCEADDPNDSTEMSLRLNTAELNLLALSLFLLCAPKMDNPIKLLVLDDPLQNMDEIKVRAVARCLWRIQQCLPNEWRMILLFHGEGDMESFKLETRAATYKLPSLGNRAVEESTAIQAEKVLTASRSHVTHMGELLQLSSSRKP